LFENQSRLFDEMLTKLAHRLELDTEAFAQCMAGGESMNKVIADAQAGKRLNLTSTPTLFINGRRVTGTFDSANAFDRAVLIEARLAEGRTLN
jgi:protein-disulfide isomerase